MQTKQLIFSLIAITAILFVSCSERQSATGTEVSGTQIFTFRWLIMLLGLPVLTYIVWI